MPAVEEAKCQFRLTISGEGVNVDRTIDQQTCGAVLAALMCADAMPSSAPTAILPPGAARLREAPALREYLDDVGAKRKPDQIVAIGNYIIQFEDQPDFSRDEVKSRFSKAREPMPANFGRDFALAIKAGWMAEAHRKPGRYYVTKAGLRAIDRKFSKDKSN